MISPQLRLARTARRFAADCSGATAVEYGVLVAGIAFAIVAVVFEIGGSVKGMFETVEGLFAN
jgi:pilus assembly protein Flp/PilA